MNRLILPFLFSASFLASTSCWCNDEPGPLDQYQPGLSDEFKQLLNNAELEAGEKTFMRKCSSCHDLAKEGGHGKGPHLWNLFGRKAGAIPGFEFSEAMRSIGHTWGYATLDYYLENTERAVPGRIMDFRGIRKEKQRADLIAFLRKFNDNPPELPE